MSKLKQFKTIFANTNRLEPIFTSLRRRIDSMATRAFIAFVVQRPERAKEARLAECCRPSRHSVSTTWRTTNACVAMTLATILLLATACQSGSTSNGNEVWAGFLEGKTIEVSSEVGGRVTKIAVQEGDAVLQGQPMVLLDDEFIRWRIQAANANVAAAEAQLALLESGARAEEIQKAQARADQARAAHLAAAQAYTDTVAIRATPQTLLIAKTDAEARAIAASFTLTATAMQAQAADLEAAFWGDQTRILEGGIDITLPRGGTLHFDTPSSRLAYVQEEWSKAGNRAWQAWAAVDTANANAIIASANLQDISDQLTNPIVLDNRVNQARAARDRAAALSQAADAALALLREGATTAQIQTARAAVDQARAAREALDQELTRYQIVAPNAGTVMRLPYRVGEIAAPNAPIVRLSVEGELKLRVFVPITALEKLRVGDTATVFASEPNNRKLAGVVTTIADRAEFSGRQTQTDSERNAQLIAVEIAVKDADAQVKAGMPASVVFGDVGSGFQLNLPTLFNRETLTFSGSLEARQTRVAAEIGGQIATVRVNRGDVVKRGDALIQLDDAAIQASLSEAQAAARAAQSNLDQVKEKARAPTIAIAEAGVAQADADLQAARAALESANRTLKTPQELLSQLHIWEGRVVAAQGEMKRAEAARGLAKSQIETAISDQSSSGKTRLAMLQRQQDAADASIAAAQTTLNASKRIVELYKQMLDQPLELVLVQHNAENQVKVAEAGLKIAQADRAIATRDAQKETIALAEAKVRGAQANLGIVQAQAKRHALSAPVDGKVVGRSGEVGETVRAGVPLVTLADTRELEMTVYVPIRNLSTIKVGQAATLKAPSIAGKSFAAKVTYIAPEAEFKPANIYNSQERSEMVFAVRVTVPNPNDELKAGLPADVTIGDQ